MQSRAGGTWAPMGGSPFFVDVKARLSFPLARLPAVPVLTSRRACSASPAGDLDLNPDTGQYRLSAVVPGVEVNALRASLGVRPTPQPSAGALAGVLHVTGPLEKPVFSGTAHGVRPTAAQLASCERTDALAALVAEPRAVGAYDRVPLASASAVFALDTAAETLQLHALHAALLDGGEVSSSTLALRWLRADATCCRRGTCSFCSLELVDNLIRHISWPPNSTPLAAARFWTHVGGTACRDGPLCRLSGC